MKKKRRVVPAVLFGIGIAALIVLIIYEFFVQAFPGLLPLLKAKDQDAIALYLKAEGKWKGLLCIYFLSVVQVISIVIPGFLIQIAAGTIYPWWEAFLFSYLGFISGNTFVFFFARRFRGRLQSFLPVNQNGKGAWLVEKMNSADPGFVVALSCLVPGVPNGIIPYIASSSNLRIHDFSYAIAVSSWIQILCNCIAGHFLIRTEYLYTVISFAVQIMLIVLIAANRDRILRYYEKRRARIRAHRKGRGRKALPGEEKEEC